MYYTKCTKYLVCICNIGISNYYGIGQFVCSIIFLFALCYASVKSIITFVTTLLSEKLCLYRCQGVTLPLKTSFQLHRYTKIINVNQYRKSRVLLCLPGKQGYGNVLIIIIYRLLVHIPTRIQMRTQTSSKIYQPIYRHLNRQYTRPSVDRSVESNSQQNRIDRLLERNWNRTSFQKVKCKPRYLFRSNCLFPQNI